MLDLEYFIAGKYICNSCMEDQHGQHTASILFFYYALFRQFNRIVTDGFYGDKVFRNAASQNYDAVILASQTSHIALTPILPWNLSMFHAFSALVHGKIGVACLA